MVLAPVVLFAVMHSASYSLTMLDVSSLQLLAKCSNIIICFLIEAKPIVARSTWQKLHNKLQSVYKRSCSNCWFFYLEKCLGHNSWWGARFLISLVEFQSRNILRLCALCEIMILPLSIILVFTWVQFFFFALGLFFLLTRPFLSSLDRIFFANIFLSKIPMTTWLMKTKFRKKCLIEWISDCYNFCNSKCLCRFQITLYIPHVRSQRLIKIF